MTDPVPAARRATAAWRRHRLVPEFDPRLIEAAVLEATRGHPREREFHSERDAVYDIVDPDRRETAFGALHEGWFTHLALDRPFHEALDEQPAACACGRWLVAVARLLRDEAADLLVAGSVAPTLLVRVRPDTVATPGRLRCLLRRELLHVADMLDPAFGYEAALPREVAGGPAERMVRGNYRVLWNAYVDGRLVRRGLLPAAARPERLAEFRRAFPHRALHAEAAFDAFFDGRDVTHAALLAFARGAPDGARRPRCSLCELPTHDFAPAPALGEHVLAAIERDFPAWRPVDGVCGRCAEVYASRMPKAQRPVPGGEADTPCRVSRRANALP
jgi:hypothetical protein